MCKHVQCSWFHFIGVTLDIGHCAIHLDIAQHIYTLGNTVKIYFGAVNLDLGHCTIPPYIAQYFQNVSEAMIFGKHALGNQGKSSGHGENSLLDTFGRVYIFYKMKS